MSKPKPPTPRSVSATLRAADFRASRDLGNVFSEGYQVEWRDMNSSVRVAFKTNDTDEFHATALTKMAAVLSRKGWQVRTRMAGTRPHYLIVTEA